MSSCVEVAPGGLPLLHETVEGDELCCIRLHVSCGSRLEGPDEEGAAHAIEHLVVRAGGRHPVLHRFDSSGATLQASTNRDETVYSLLVSEKEASKAVDAIVEAVFDPKFEPSDWESERGVILQELGFRRSQASWRRLQHSFEDVWRGTTCEHSPLGSFRSLSQLQLPRLRAFHARHYDWGRSFLSVAGGQLHTDRGATGPTIPPIEYWGPPNSCQLRKCATSVWGRGGTYELTLVHPCNSGLRALVDVARAALEQAGADLRVDEYGSVDVLWLSSSGSDATAADVSSSLARVVDRCANVAEQVPLWKAQASMVRMLDHELVERRASNAALSWLRDGQRSALVPYLSALESVDATMVCDFLSRLRACVQGESTALEPRTFSIAPSGAPERFRGRAQGVPVASSTLLVNPGSVPLAWCPRTGGTTACAVVLWSPRDPLGPRGVAKLSLALNLHSGLMPAGSVVRHILDEECSGIGVAVPPGRELPTLHRLCELAAELAVERAPVLRRVARSWRAFESLQAEALARLFPDAQSSESPRPSCGVGIVGPNRIDSALDLPIPLNYQLEAPAGAAPPPPIHATSGHLHLLLAGAGLPIDSEDRVALHVASAVLDGMGSRLYRRLRRDEQLAYTFRAFSRERRGLGYSCVYAVAAPEKAERVSQVIAEEWWHLAREPVPEAELDRARRRVLLQWQLVNQSTLFRARLLARYALHQGRGISPDRYAQRVNEVHAGDVMHVWRTCREASPGIELLSNGTWRAAPTVH